MSAWICSHRHINLIASYAAVHDIKIEWQGGIIDCARQQQDVATVLLDENYRSVNYRYDENNSDTIVFEGQVTSVTPTFMYKQLACYDYQACEAPDYKQTLAKAIVDACIAEVERVSGRTVEQLRGEGVMGSKEWQAAPWGVD